MHTHGPAPVPPDLVGYLADLAGHVGYTTNPDLALTLVCAHQPRLACRWVAAAARHAGAAWTLDLVGETITAAHRLVAATADHQLAGEDAAAQAAVLHRLHRAEQRLRRRQHEAAFAFEGFCLNLAAADLGLLTPHPHPGATGPHPSPGGPS